MRVKLLLADDHQIMRQGLLALVNAEPDMDVVGEAGDGRQAVKLALKLRPHVVLMDINMPDLNGIDATRQLLAQAPEIKILALSMHTNRKLVLGMLQAGASGYLLKDCAFEELITAIRALANGQIFLSSKVAGTLLKDYRKLAAFEDQLQSFPLTAREREVLQLIGEGRASKEIAHALSLSVKTVETHRRNILQKLNLKNTAELIRFAIQEGLTSLTT